MNSKTQPVEAVFHGVFLSCGLLSVAFVVGITAYLVISGMPAIMEVGPVDFLLGQIWNPGQDQSSSWQASRRLSTAWWA